MLRRPLLRALGLMWLALIMLTGSTRGESPATLASFQFLLGQWEGIGDQAGATGGFEEVEQALGRPEAGKLTTKDRI